MKKFFRLTGLLIFFLSSVFFSWSCAPATSGYIKSLAGSDPVAYLKNTPKQEEHPNAPAVALLENIYVEIEDDGTEINRETSRYKILSERGYDFARKTAGYREGYSEVKIIYANTIKADGTVVPLDQKDIKDFSPYASYEFYTDIKEKRFTMPAVEPGCVVEYCIETRQYKSVFPNDIYIPFSIKSYIPLKEDSLEIVLPKNLKLQIKMFKTDLKPEITENGSKMRYLFRNRDQEEILPEIGMPSLSDREEFPQFAVWTLSDWDGIASWYNKLVTAQMKSDKEMESFTAELIKNCKNDREKIRAIFYFVSQKIRYVAVELGPNTHEPHPANEVFKKRYGDCKDKTTLMLTMLKLAGIEGLPALVPESVDEFFDESMPSLSAFNHVIAVVKDSSEESGYLWLDGTDEVAAFGGIPFYQPVRALVIDREGKGKFVKTPGEKEDRDYYAGETSIKVDENGDAEIEILTQSFGKTAEGARYSYKYNSPDERKKAIEKSGIELISLDLANIENTEVPFWVRIKGKVRGVVQRLDENTLLLSNIINVDAYERVVSAKERKYPISFSNSLRSISKNTYTMPEGYILKTLPPEYKRDEPYKKSYIKYVSKGNVLEIESSAKGCRYKIAAKDFEDFKKKVEKLKKYKTDYSNAVFVKKLKEGK